MKISFIVLLCIVFFATTFVLAFPTPQSGGKDSSSGGKGSSSGGKGSSSGGKDGSQNTPPPITPSSSQGKVWHPEVKFNVTSPKTGQCFQPTSDITVRWTSTYTDEKVLIKILYYDDPSFSLGLDPKNEATASAGTFTIKAVNWPNGSYMAMVELESDSEQFGSSGRFRICDKTTTTSKTSDTKKTS
ncbi:5258_t:CDS:2 [Gigaspora margarita]|uniref:5258_t:CDS:1 n=1 Tax=Gigaspora margarita TaxID=4874 RepID=A0ABN7UXB0_GIGMA|nr:5258_t:CDS:2 [Gigaspora margarita]